MDVCLVASGLVFDSPGWLDRLRARTGNDGAPAAIAGGAVIEPDGHRSATPATSSRASAAPGARACATCPRSLLDVDDPLLCPVGSELQFVRNEWIEKVGLYDELLDGPHAALDYCIRVSRGRRPVRASSRRCAPARCETPSGEPDEASRDEQRLRLKHSARQLLPLDPGGDLMPEIPKTLFLGLGASVVSYYRCFLPAVALGADYAIWGGEQPVRFGGGFGDRPPKLDDLFDYDVVVLQYGSGKHWLKLTRQLQDAGVTVLYEIDDYVHAARKSKTHEMAGAFGADRLRHMEMVMRVADGIICSTVVHRAPLPLVQRRAPGSAATASTSSATSTASRRARA